ncbi:MAG: XRE family transcriptional regulator [Ruminococcaceae bacterium]|nr:XRE family transcriptional regulator [Oscillospiraceae bacterium]
MELEKLFAKNLKVLRKKNNITQKDLAEALGCSEKAVSKWECGLSIPDIELLLSVSKYLKTSVESLFSENDKTYLLGIDGGGTKTALLLCESNGEPLRKSYADCSNPIDIGIDKSTNILKQAIFDICDGIPFSSIVCFAGIAGSTSGGIQKELNEFFSSFGFLAFKTDTDNANIIATGLGDGDGITLILGTGVCSFLQKDKRHTQIAGRGYFLDNGGSGFDIGRDALIAYYRERDGIGKQTMITKLISNDGFDDLQQLLFRIYDEGKKFIASFSRYVYIAAEKGDDTANEIIKLNMKNAAGFVLANAGKLTQKRIPLVLAGGLTNDPLTLFYLKEALGTTYNFDIKILDREPVYGAVTLAKELYEENVK